MQTLDKYLIIEGSVAREIRVTFYTAKANSSYTETVRTLKLNITTNYYRNYHDIVIDGRSTIVFNADGYSNFN